MVDYEIEVTILEANLPILHDSLTTENVTIEKYPDLEIGEYGSYLRINQKDLISYLEIENILFILVVKCPGGCYGNTCCDTKTGNCKYHDGSGGDNCGGK